MPSGKSYDLREKAKDAASPYAGDKSKSPAKAAGAPASPSKAAPASPSKAAAPASPSKASHAPASPTKPATMASPARPVSPTGTKPTSAAAGHSSPSRIPIPTPVGQAHAHAHRSGSSPTTKPASPTKQLRDQVNKEVAKLGGSIQSKVLPNHGVVPKVTTKTVVQSQTPARSPTAGSPTKPTSPSGKAAASSSSAASGSAKLGVQAQPTVGKTPQKAALTPDQIKKGLTHAGATSSPKSHSK